MKKYWQSLEQLNETPEFLDSAKNEFAQDVPTSALGRKKAQPQPLPLGGEFNQAIHNGEDLGGAFSRRDFLKLMGFSAGAATLAACETPVQKTIPYLIKPEEITPGIANWYASTYFDGHDYCPILVKTREGRPIKIEGNKLSEITHGGASARIQASVLSLYDSERLKAPIAKGENVSWEKADDEIMNLLGASDKVREIRIISSTIISPSAKQVVADFISKYPSAKHIVYDAVSYYAIAKAHENIIAQKIIPCYNFDKANVIVSFAADFLVNWLSPVEYAFQYAQKRKVSREENGKVSMSKHIQFESVLSVTGSNADLRVPLKPSQIGTAVINLYNAIASKAGESRLPSSSQSVDTPFLKEGWDGLAKALWDNKGKSLVVCGINDVAIQTIVAAINKLLDNYGNTIDIINYSNLHQGNDEDFAELIEEMNNGKISSLLIYNSNPAYTAPGFADAMKKVGLKISFAGTMDETALLCDYVCPDHHYLESWNDAEPKKNQFSLAQPTISPIYNTRSAQETFMKWSGNNSDYHSYIKNTWKNFYPGITDFTGVWNKSLHDGVATMEINVAPAAENKKDDKKKAEPKKDEKKAEVDVEKKQMSIADAAAIISKEKGEGLELVLYEKTGTGIGNQANNPWLQELPDPVSKCTWDNYLTMNPADMSGKYSLLKRDDYMGDVVELRISNPKSQIPNPKSIKVPVFPQPGQARGTAGLALGYGRTSAGKVANGVGVNAYQFLEWRNKTLQNYLSGVKISEATGEKHEFACTQTHHTVMGRSIVKETTIDSYLNKPKDEWNPSVLIPVLNKEGHHTKSPVPEVNLWDDHEKPSYRWGLAIDLQACIGCGACVVACSAENNVPVVGKTEVRKSREMHWIRIDRYYSSDMNEEKGKEEDKGKIETLREMEKPSENPKVVFQPVMCQHCNHAPCETVCPVLATTHSSEGLNMMTYNRCIGTRYCANNCPYKVRRFNWFQYDSNKQFADVNPASWGNDLGRMVLNPDVVVRSRGVMEKCTLCVHRIQEGKLNAKKEERKLKDGEIQTACQQSCPANALIFGDLNNSETEISKLFNDDRRYLLLEEVGVQPNAFYLTKVRNG